MQERKQYANKVKAVIHKLKVPEEKRTQLWNILDQQRKQAKIAASNDRKARILSALFLNQEKTILLLNLYKEITEKFMYYTKKYQASKPQMHNLHNDLFRLTNKFHAGFIAPDAIPVHNVSQLKDLYLDDKSHQLKIESLVWENTTCLFYKCAERQRNKLLAECTWK